MFYKGPTVETDGSVCVISQVSTCKERFFSLFNKISNPTLFEFCCILLLVETIIVKTEFHRFKSLFIEKHK